MLFDHVASVRHLEEIESTLCSCDGLFWNLGADGSSARCNLPKVIAFVPVNSCANISVCTGQFVCEYQRLYRAIHVRISAFVPGNSCANISVCVRLHKAKLFTGDCCVPVAVYHLLFILTGMTENRVNLSLNSWSYYFILLEWDCYETSHRLKKGLRGIFMGCLAQQ